MSVVKGTEYSNKLNINYNKKRKLPSHCSSCGKYIGLNQKPRYCDKCHKRQKQLKSSNDNYYTSKGLPNTHKLKIYKIPTEPWKYYLYCRYKEIGLNALASEIGVPSRSLMNHIFTPRKPNGKNYKAILEYFRKYKRNEIVLELQIYEI